MLMELREDIVKCLSVDMSLNMEHFHSKFNDLDEPERDMASEYISTLFQCANDVKCGLRTYDEFTLLDSHFENGELHELLQAMFDCFNVYAKYDGVELIKEIYAHTNRGGDDWFPVAIIKQPLDDYSDLSDDIVIYRGCNLEEFDSNRFCQSWTTDIARAIHYAYIHYPHLDKNKRIVVKAKIKKEDIFLTLNMDSEVVINLNAMLAELTIAETEYKGSLQL